MLRLIGLRVSKLATFLRLLMLWLIGWGAALLVWWAPLGALLAQGLRLLWARCPLL